MVFKAYHILCPGYGYRYNFSTKDSPKYAEIVLNNNTKNNLIKKKDLKIESINYVVGYFVFDPNRFGRKEYYH